MRLGMVPIESPLISSIESRGTPKGSQDLTVGSLVPAGLYFPIGLLASNICLPSGVSGGAGCSAKTGTPEPESGPAQVPLRSRLGAGPPVPTALSFG